MAHKSCLSLIFLLVAELITNVESDCRKTFLYHPKYRYGYEIFCTKTTSQELSTTMANNAISLQIVDSSVAIDSKTFKYLKKIHQLFITNSQIQFRDGNGEKLDESMETKKNVFSALTNLETFAIQNCNITTSRLAYLYGLENLTTLKLDNDSIDNLPSDAFTQLKNLKTLSLNHNRIKRITDLSLCDLGTLQQLDLGNNLITDLKNEDIKCLTQLKVLNLSGNALTKLENVQTNNLHVLSVALNQISFIQQIDAPNLTTLDLSANKLTNVTANDFKGLNSLQKLDLSWNNLTSVMLINKQLTDLNLSHNALEHVPPLPLEELRILNLAHNRIMSLNTTSLLTVKKLETFDISSNNMMKIDEHCFVQMINITSLDLSQNNFSDLALYFVENSKLMLFNVSHNYIRTMSSNWFTNLTNLKHFDVSFNKLKSLNDSTFKQLENLETLNMSNNLLTQLDYRLLEPLETLIILDVDNNMIQELDYSSIVSELPNLDAFKVKNNLLTCEFLTKMIHYFKENDITFSLNEHLDFGKENVEGIYCKETRSKLENLKKTEEILKNNTKVLNAFYAMYSHDSSGITIRENEFKSNHSYTLSGGEIVAAILFLVSLVVIITLGTQKTMLWYRRKNYFVDELELMSNEPYNRLA